MPFPILAAANVALQAYSAFSAKKGQEDANRAQMEFNANEAQKQRDWESHMFNTRYQHTRSDLEAAGYNPLLALGGQPPVPTGAAAHAEPKSTRSELAHIVSNSAKQVSDVTLQSAMLGKVNAEASSAKSLARLHAQEADIATSSAGKKLAAFRYFLDKSGVGRGAQNVMNILGAKQAIRSIMGSAKARVYRRYPPFTNERDS